MRPRRIGRSDTVRRTLLALSVGVALVLGACGVGGGGHSHSGPVGGTVVLRAV